MNYTGIKFSRIENMVWKDKTYHDYVFTVEGDSLKEMNRMYSEQGFVTVGDIHYGQEDKQIGIQLIYHWNQNYTINIPDGLQEHLDSLILELHREERSNE